MEWMIFAGFVAYLMIGIFVSSLLALQQGDHQISLFAIVVWPIVVIFWLICMIAWLPIRFAEWVTKNWL